MVSNSLQGTVQHYGVSDKEGDIATYIETAPFGCFLRREDELGDALLDLQFPALRVASQNLAELLIGLP
jgi:hypothetical protein